MSSGGRAGGRRGATPTAQPTRAVLLRSVDFGEADRILTLLTDAHGRIAVMARGARRSQKRFGGALEPFAIVEASVAMGTGEVGRLAEARVLRAFPKLIGSLDAMREAGHALELVRSVSPQRHGEPRLLDAIAALFEELDRDATSVGVFARSSLRVLAIVGLAPRLTACVSCGRSPEAGQAALFDAARGGIVCRACGGGALRLSGRARAFMIDALRAADDPAPDGDSGHTTSEVARSEIARTDLSDIEVALDAFVKRHVRG